VTAMKPPSPQGISALLAVPEGPALFPRVIIGYDEKGFPCLADDCPECTATALIVNEWNAVECLSCSWREFEPDSPRASDAAPLESTCGFCDEHLTLRLGEWMDDCYGSACTDTSAAFVPHKPEED
jgi:hypothetical protein